MRTKYKSTTTNRKDVAEEQRKQYPYLNFSLSQNLGLDSENP